MKLKRRDIVSAIIGALVALSVSWQWRANKSGAAALDEREIPVVAKNKEDLPAMVRGDFYSPHLSLEDLLTDNFLDSLIRSSKKKEVLDEMYGKPSSVTRRSDSEAASYNLAVYDEGLRLKGGRVGFIATFKNGSIISWSPITQVNGK